MIVTLAGHVDHGKTTLVRSLTGVDTDRLTEEKRRGLTIDLGFAHLSAGDTVVAFVDVPGHHRFIHNMVAGVAATQHALLVIAADDGPMPQSREHLQILSLLGVRLGIVALTKCDLVPPVRIAEARREIAGLTSGTFLAGAPIVETSTTTGSGIDVLRSTLLAAAAKPPAPLQDRAFRMPVDRAFSLRGAGLVVTGTVHDGRIGIEDEVHVFPIGATARVRDLRVHDRPGTSAGSGQRAAINLAGLDRHALRRGHWLCATPEPGHASLVIDLEVLEDFPRDVKHWSPVHVYHATSHSTARLALLRSPRLPPGGRDWAELVLDVPLPGKRGDRIVVRDQALERTLGGGVVLDNRPASGRRRDPARLDTIAACAAPAAGEALRALLALGPVEVAAFAGLWNPSATALESLVNEVATVFYEGWFVDTGRWERWRALLLEECRQRHRDDPALQGLRENDFEAAVPARFRGRLLDELVAAGELERRTGRFQPSRHRVVLTAEEQSLLERLEPLLATAQPPSLGDLGRMLHMPSPRLKPLVMALASKGALVQINDKRVYLPAQVNALAETAESLGGPFTAAAYRDAAGIGRNVAIDLLEYFDARGFTRRRGDTRTVTGDRSKLVRQLR